MLVLGRTPWLSTMRYAVHLQGVLCFQNRFKVLLCLLMHLHIHSRQVSQHALIMQLKCMVSMHCVCLEHAFDSLSGIERSPQNSIAALTRYLFWHTVPIQKEMSSQWNDVGHHFLDDAAASVAQFACAE